MTGSSTYVPVVVQELFATRLDQPIVGVAAGRLASRRVGHERTALLHAGEHAGHALGAFQASVVGLDQFLLAYAARRCQDGDTPLISRPPYPALVRVALLEHDRFDGIDADHLVEEVDEVLWTLEPLDVAAQDDAVPAGVDELDSSAQQHQQSLHGLIS